MVYKLNDCAKVKDLVKRRQKVSSKKLCFKCLKSGHCTVHGLTRTCFKCNQKHYTLLCINNQLQDNSSKRDQEPKEKMLVSFGEKNVCWLIVTFYANEIHCKALVDMGPRSSYSSTALIIHISASLVQRKTRQIEMLFHIMFKNIEIHKIIISD